MKNKITAGVLALLLGSLGVHKFYLGKSGKGILYLCFFWTIIPGIFAIIEGIQLLTMSELDFDKNYNPQISQNEKLQKNEEELSYLTKKQELIIEEMEAILERDYKNGNIDEGLYNVRKKQIILERKQLKK